MTEVLTYQPDTDILHRDERCRPLLRLHQLALEIADALATNNLEMVERASNLLPNTLQACEQIDPTFVQQNAVVLEFVNQTSKLLWQCDTQIQQVLQDISGELRRIRQSQKNRNWILQQEYAVVGRRVDTSR